MRGAWIEILLLVRWTSFFASLPVRGAWIEIDGLIKGGGRVAGRSPCGERGLKLCCGYADVTMRASLPVRGAWIEISGR